MLILCSNSRGSDDPWWVRQEMKRMFGENDKRLRFNVGVMFIKCTCVFVWFVCVYNKEDGMRREVGGKEEV